MLPNFGPLPYRLVQRLDRMTLGRESGMVFIIGFSLDVAVVSAVVVSNVLVVAADVDVASGVIAVDQLLTISQRQSTAKQYQE